MDKSSGFSLIYKKCNEEICYKMKLQNKFNSQNENSLHW